MSLYRHEKYSGPFLGTVRRWMQRTFSNGDSVKWGSLDVLDHPRRDLSPLLFEELACEIRDAVIQQFGIKDTDHEYRYAVFCLGSGTFVQYADTAKEIWTALFDCTGPVRIVVQGEDKDASISECLFHGDAEEAKAWVRKNKERCNGVEDETDRSG